MKVLWLTNDRTNRVHDFFGPLTTALDRYCYVHTIRRELPCLEGEYCRRQVVLGHGNEPLVDVDFANNFDVIVTDAIYSYLHEDWRHITTPRAVMWGDNHGSAVRTYIDLAFSFGFKIFLPLYWCSLRNFLPWLVDGTQPSVRAHWLPYWVNPVFKDYCEPKRIHALMTGVVHKTVYPLRYKADEELRKKAWYTRIPRPPENMQRDGYAYVDEAYARLLNSARLCITCTSKHKYPLGKIFEIPGSRSVLACDWNSELQMLGFLPHENFLPLSMAEPIATQIARFKDFDGVARRGFEMVHEMHGVQKRAHDLYQILTGEAFT